MTFKSRDWAFYESIGGYYFIIPDGLKLTKLVDQSNTDILNHYKSEGAGGDEYRALKMERENLMRNGVGLQGLWTMLYLINGRKKIVSQKFSFETTAEMYRPLLIN